MTKEKLKLYLPYLGLPIFIATFIILKINHLDTLNLLLFLLLIIFGYIASVIDLTTKTIPNILVLAMLGVWVIFIIPQLFVNIDRTISVLWESGFGFAISGTLMMIVYLISRKRLGGGDVKFMAAAGLYLGMSYVLSAMLFGSILAGLTGITLIIIKKKGRKDTIPLAPFLFLGILITVFFI